MIRVSNPHLARAVHLSAAIPACLMSLAWSSGAAADTAVEAASGALEEITVTAEKRSQDLQQVPLSISAFTGYALEVRGVQSTAELAEFTPGLQFTSNAVIGQPYIRGIGSNQLNVGSDPSVSVYIDGVYLTRPIDSTQQLMDVDRVEVLKGPQGTLYGRNATGGVINIISKAPTDSFTGAGEITYGNYNTVRAGVTLSGPLTDKVAARITVQQSNHDGYVSNIFNGGKLDNLNQTTARAIIDLTPTDDLKLRFEADGSSERDSRNEAGIVFSYGPATLKYGAPTGGGSATNINSPTYAHIQQAGASVTADYTMGDLTATSITAYRFSKFNLGLDLDFTNITFGAENPEFEISRTVTQELRLASSDKDRFYWLAGFYYLHELGGTNAYITEPLFHVISNPVGNALTDAYAGYGQASYWVLPDAVRVTGGLRYSIEDRSVDVKQFTNLKPASTFDHASSYYALTPKFGLDWFVTPDLMAYASVTRGFKSGGFNATSTSNPPFMPEKVWAYEIGVKDSFFDKRVQVNAAGFYYDYSDLQVITDVPGALSIINNAAAATIKGLEFDGQARATPEILVNLGVSLLDARYDSYNTIDPDRPKLGLLNLKGYTLPRAPKMTISAGAEYDLNRDWGLLQFRADYSYTSDIYFTPYDTPGVTQGAYSLVNARISYDPAGTTWEFSLWAKNLFNRTYSVDILTNSGFYGIFGLPGDPRTFGATAKYTF